MQINYIFGGKIVVHAGTPPPLIDRIISGMFVKPAVVGTNCYGDCTNNIGYNHASVYSINDQPDP